MLQPTIQDYTKNKLALIVQETTAYELSYSDLHPAYIFALEPHFNSPMPRFTKVEPGM